MRASCSFKLRLASDRRHLDETLHAIVAHAGAPEVTYEISDSPETGPLGMPLSTTVTFDAEREDPDALAREVEEAIERAGLGGRFERQPRS